MKNFKLESILLLTTIFLPQVFSGPSASCLRRNRVAPITNLTSVCNVQTPQREESDYNQASKDLSNRIQDLKKFLKKKKQKRWAELFNQTQTIGLYPNFHTTLNNNPLSLSLSFQSQKGFNNTAVFLVKNENFNTILSISSIKSEKISSLKDLEEMLLANYKIFFFLEGKNLIDNAYIDDIKTINKIRCKTKRDSELQRMQQRVENKIATIFFLNKETICSTANLSCKGILKIIVSKEYFPNSQNKTYTFKKDSLGECTIA